jgi:hypothetical protein
MKRSIPFVLLLALFAIEASPGPFDLRIKEIFERPYDLAWETVILAGKVIKLTETEAISTKAYILRDDWGDEIKIITNKAALPELDHRYLVTGMVFVDNTDKENPEVNIFERSRQMPQEYTGQYPPGKKNAKLVNVLFGIAAVLLVVIAVLAVFLISGKYKDSITPASYSLSGFPESTPAGYPEPSAYIEDSSIRMAVPPEGTLKLLPARLEIVGGYDQFMDIRFYKHPVQEETEFIFGRVPGTPYFHFQLKSPTVSAKHAKILWTNGKYMLINYSTTNPTKVNGKTLDKDESVTLEDNNIIEMGEITLKFHEQ